MTTPPLPATGPTTGPAASAAVELLRALSGPAGIHASLSDTANYRAVFARDGVMAGVAGLLLGDAAVTAGLVRTLERLRDLQGPEGQIASNYELRDGAAPQVSFGTVVPRVDSATWYLVGVALAARAGALDAGAYRASVAAVVRLLDALEYNGRDLVYVPAGGNWADEYLTEGYILYDQVLRAWGLRLLGAVYDEPAWAAKAARIGVRVAERFWPAADVGRRYPIASFTPIAVRDVYDLAAAALLGVSRAAPELADRALAYAADAFLARGVLPPAFSPVVHETDPDWAALRRYHLYAFRNRPHEYHNGGVWPIWLGWLALALARAGRGDDLARLRALVAERLAAHPGYAFEEYLHGVTAEPGGTARMAYSATGLVFLELADSPATAELFA
ncbi:hypothetical protein tb265_22310 [Gemmatimonadetes bacterium T265]|nr:hypothetical protein tb265_22310 [Gemmatimonadetes bacterium T265]